MIQTFIHRQFVFFQVESKNFSVLDLEKHETKDITDSHINGELTVVWRDWDNLIKKHPKMVYVNSVNPGEIKVTLTLNFLKSKYIPCVKLFNDAFDAV